MEQAVSQLKSHIHDEKYFSARGFSWLNKKTGIASEQLALGLAVVLALYLEVGEENFLVANGLLTIYPALVTYFFTDERPTRDLLLAYWSCFGFLTVFDRYLELFPLYYSLKIALLALFFIEPFCLAERLTKWIETLLEEHNMLTQSELHKIYRKNGHSPRPTKPVQSPEKLEPSKKEVTLKTACLPPKVTPKEEVQLTTAHLPVVKEPPKPKEDVNMTTARLPVVEEPSKEVQKEEEPKPTSDYCRTLVEKTAVSPGNGLTDGRPLYKGVNPMETDSSYRLHTEGPGIDNKEIEPAANLHDLIIWPHEALVFNAPFDYDDLTYHMTVKNNSRHQLVFAIKGNCIPRVTAHPPHAILATGETTVVAVTVRKFVWNEFDYEKDRIVFEYVLLKLDKMTTTFSHELLQKSDIRRRKNILIRYNV